MSAAVFLDIDNTIWDYQHAIPESTVTALQELAAHGHLAFLCSGRARGYIYAPELLSLPLSGIVAACGNHVEINGMLLYEHYLTYEELQTVYASAARNHMPFILEGPEFLWLNPEDFSGDAYVERLVVDAAGRWKRLEDLKPEDRVNKFSAAILDETDYSAVKRDLEGFIDFLDHNGKVVEFIPKGSGKAQGIRKTCELLNISLEDTYAVGDSVNDLDMLRLAAHGICMGNGSDEAKAAADYVTTALFDDGIYHAFSHFHLI